jgi:hypothetical protein
MAHVRQQIREAFATVLTTANVASTISSSRVYPLPADTTTAALIYTNADSVTDTTLHAPRNLTRELIIVVECVARKLTDLDDQLDTLCKNVENAVGANNTLSGLVKDCILADTTITHDFTGDAPIGSARMQFRVMYRTAENNAEISV